MPECGSAAMWHQGSSCCLERSIPVCSTLLPTAGRTAAASWIEARAGAPSSPPEGLRNPYGSKSLLLALLSSLCPVIFLLNMGMSVSGGGQQSPVLCIKTVVLMRSELLP